MLQVGDDKGTARARGTDGRSCPKATGPTWPSAARQILCHGLGGGRWGTAQALKDSECTLPDTSPRDNAPPSHRASESTRWKAGEPECRKLTRSPQRLQLRAASTLSCRALAPAESRWAGCRRLPPHPAGPTPGFFDSDGQAHRGHRQDVGSARIAAIGPGHA